ncbi:hypothetical protein D3C87_1647190 [compost metagenome]
MRPASARAAGNSSTPGTTRDTKPHSSAVAALMASPVNDISAARAMPIRRGRNQAPPSPGMMPSLTKLSANVAASDAMRTSHMQARSQPAPMAGPFTAAIVGTSSACSASGRR